ncbi:MAG: DNA-3-methyladenine glycosylase 2 family protein [Actinomycetota bacterium]|nr:DNA-3-methyladenine glycosylase 2 family protein [Actinomycetota bacterium]MDQ3573495.1 DNA-3-methyladenine glycosylase 2 family protein [Actinomycetota bacterium]
MNRWALATTTICERDPAMAAAVATIGACTLSPRRHRGGSFAALARSIVYQQLAGRAAAAIHARFVALYGGRPTPEAVLTTPDETLRGAGLSAAKGASIKDLAARVLDGRLRLGGLGRLADQEVITRLSTVRGIGPWTAEMFLIFQLLRPDVWPVGDLGVRMGYARVHGLDAPPTPPELSSLGERYRPHRTVAAWYCWRERERAATTRASVSPPPATW